MLDNAMGYAASLTGGVDGQMRVMTVSMTTQYIAPVQGGRVVATGEVTGGGRSLFFADGELRGRDMSKIPHPFITESMERFAELPKAERNKVRFLHLNHTNPALDSHSPEAKRVRDAGHHVAGEGERFKL